MKTTSTYSIKKQGKIVSKNLSLYDLRKFAFKIRSKSKVADVDYDVIDEVSGDTFSMHYIIL